MISYFKNLSHIGYFFIFSVLAVSIITLIKVNHQDARINIPISEKENSHLGSEVNLKGVGVLGDSLSDEYQADDIRGSYLSFPVYNWVELLSRYKEVNFGEWKDNRPEPRRDGYEYNWSRSGATAQTMIDSGQHTGLAQQVRENRVNVAIIYVGANDYAPYTADGYPAIYNGSLTDEQLEEKANSIVGNITQAVDTLQNSGEVSILLLKIPDWGNKYSVQQSYPDRSKRERVSNAIMIVNDKLEVVARGRNVFIADPNEFFTDLIEETSDSLISIDEVMFDLTTPSNNPTSVFLSDDIHLGTVMNGLFANYIISHLNAQVSNDIELFTNQELFSISGINQ